MSINFIPELVTAQELKLEMGQRIQQRRLEKNLSRQKLSQLSGVPARTIESFEKGGTISLRSFIALAIELGHAQEFISLMAQPKFTTMQELDTINNNKSRRRGRK